MTSGVDAIRASTRHRTQLLRPSMSAAHRIAYHCKWLSYFSLGPRAAVPSKSPLRRVHPRKRPCWRRSATSALGQEPPLPARSVKLDFRREFREKAPSPPCSARENVVSRTAYTSEESVPVLRRQRGGNLSFRH